MNRVIGWVVGFFLGAFVGRYFENIRDFFIFMRKDIRRVQKANARSMREVKAGVMGK